MAMRQILKQLIHKMVNLLQRMTKPASTIFQPTKKYILTKIEHFMKYPVPPVESAGPGDTERIAVPVAVPIAVPVAAPERTKN